VLPRVSGLERLARSGLPPIHLTVDGARADCWPSETVAVVLLALNGRVSSGASRKRGVFCCIGLCYECAVEVNGVPGTRACLTEVSEGMEIRTGESRRANGI
jgi:predicted molibdopterin-dependent oxidoreductase YjgC